MEEAKMFNANLGVCVASPELALTGYIAGMEALTLICSFAALLLG